MKFSKIIGVSNNPETKKIIKQAEDRLSSAFTDLSLRFDNRSIGSSIGGDSLIFSLTYPLPHICDITEIQLAEIDEQSKEIKARIDAGQPLNDDEAKIEGIKKFRSQMRGRVLTTAATDGARFYWNPLFINKLSKIGLRIVLAHEATHAGYMHPSRRGSRMHSLFNIALDYKVNYFIMRDLKAREQHDPVAMFKEHLGDFMTLEEYSSLLKDPYNPPARLAHMNPIHNLKKQIDKNYPDPWADKGSMFYADYELSQDMKRPENIYDHLLAQIPKCPKCGKLGMYKKSEEYKKAEKELEEKMEKEATEAKEKADKEASTAPDAKKEADKGKKKEKSAGAPGLPEKGGADKGCCDEGEEQKSSSGPGQGEEAGEGPPGDQPGSGQGAPGEGQAAEGSCCAGEESTGGAGQPGQGQPGQGAGSSCCGGDEGCGTGPSCDCCGDGKGGSENDYEYRDMTGAGDLVDGHLSTDVTEEELAKRMHDATEMAKRMGAGTIGFGLEDEISELSAPKMTWKDVLKMKLKRIVDGVGRADYTRPKTRPLFAGIYAPKKKSYQATMLVAYDCSGSMSADDISFGISQLQSLDAAATIYLLSWDTVPYFDKMVKIHKADKENLMKAKRVGLGGTDCRKVFEEYEEHCGKVDVIVMISDGYLSDNELNGVVIPKGTEVLWLITSDNPSFKPSFGRVMHLKNE